MNRDTLYFATCLEVVYIKKERKTDRNCSRMRSTTFLMNKIHSDLSLHDTMSRIYISKIKGKTMSRIYIIYDDEERN